MLCTRRYPIGLAGMVLLLASPSLSMGQVVFQQTNLVSSVAGMAPVTDANLKNPWGMSSSPTSPIWVSNQVTGTATLYNGAGQPQSLVVTVPSTGNPGGPTGQVFNNAGAFQLSNGSNATFLFANLNGSISGWNSGAGTTAIVSVSSTQRCIHRAGNQRDGKQLTALCGRRGGGSDSHLQFHLSIDTCWRVRRSEPAVGLHAVQHSKPRWNSFRHV